MYEWLLTALKQAFREERLLKRSPRGSVHLLRHEAGGQRFVLRRFTGNAEVYRRLLHCTCRNLPAVYEVASQQGALFTVEETRSVVDQVCRALWVLHDLAAVHRDVKPENIILRGSEAVLIDFDAARLYKPEEDTDTQVLGTAGFAAPEQYGLSQSDTRTDIYATGILINVMLTGKHPSKKLAEGRMGRIVTRCTQVNPKKRYQSVLQLMEAL